MADLFDFKDYGTFTGPSDETSLLMIPNPIGMNNYQPKVIINLTDIGVLFSKVQVIIVTSCYWK